MSPTVAPAQPPLRILHPAELLLELPVKNLQFPTVATRGKWPFHWGPSETTTSTPARSRQTLEGMSPSLRQRLRRRHFGLYRATVVDANDPEESNRLQVSVPSLSGSPLAWAPTLRDLGPRPQADDEVLVGFEAGELASPYVVGVLATGPSEPVEMADENGNSIRLTASGIEIEAAVEVRLSAAASVEVSAGSVDVDAAMSDFSGVLKSSTLITDSVVAASYTPGAGNVL